MDANDIELDLQALQRLYGLLHREGQSTTTKDELDEHTRLLLKNLLDTETRRVFKAHSEMIAGQVRTLDVNIGKNGNVCVSGSQYRKRRCKVCQGNTLKQLKSVEGIKFYDDGTQNPKEVVTLQDQQKNQLNHFVWDKEQEIGSVMNFSSLNSENERKIGTYGSKLKGIGSTAFSSNGVLGDEVCNFSKETSGEPREIDYLSREASEAIKQIEMCISALQLGAHLSQEKDDVRETELPNPVLHTVDGVIPLIDLSRGGNLAARNDIQYKLASQRLEDPFDSLLHPMPVRTTNQLKQMELPNLMSSHPSNVVQCTDSMLGPLIIHRVRSRDSTIASAENFGKSKELEGFNIVEEQNATCNRPSNWPMYFLPQNMRENLYPNQMAMINRRIGKHGTVQQLSPFTSLTDFGKSSRNNSSVVCRHKVTQQFPDQTMGLNSKDKPTKFSVPSSSHEYQSVLHKDSDPRNMKDISPVRDISSDQDSEGTASSSYSSNWISEQASSIDGESEDDSMPVPHRRIRYLGSESRSDSTAYFPSHGTESQYSSYTSNSEGDIYSSASSARADQETSTSGYNSEGNFSYDQPSQHYSGSKYISMKSRKGMSSPTRILKSAHRKKQQKQSGKWKRLKDSLGIIFHHHHHHHHYDDDEDDGGDYHGGDQTKMSHRKSSQKNVGKNFRPRTEGKAYGEQAVEKLGKSLIRERHGKNQHKHFRGLMEGLLRHVRRSKKSKPAKDGIKQLSKGQHGSKKPLKTLHWWQLLQHHRGSKLPNKPHRKIGLNKKKDHLKVLPKI